MAGFLRQLAQVLRSLPKDLLAPPESTPAAHPAGRTPAKAATKASARSPARRR